MRKRRSKDLSVAIRMLDQSGRIFLYETRLYLSTTYAFDAVLVGERVANHKEVITIRKRGWEGREIWVNELNSLVLSERNIIRAMERASCATTRVCIRQMIRGGHTLGKYNVPKIRLKNPERERERDVAASRLTHSLTQRHYRGSRRFFKRKPNRKLVERASLFHRSSTGP